MAVLRAKMTRSIAIYIFSVNICAYHKQRLNHTKVPTD